MSGLSPDMRWNYTPDSLQADTNGLVQQARTSSQQTAKINHKLCAHQCHEGFWISPSPSPSDHPAHANQPADQSTVCEGKSETHKGSFKLWTSIMNVAMVSFASFSMAWVMQWQTISKPCKCTERKQAQHLDAKSKGVRNFSIVQKLVDDPFTFFGFVQTDQSFHFLHSLQIVPRLFPLPPVCTAKLRENKFFSRLLGLCDCD